MIISGAINVDANGIISLSVAERYSIVCLYHLFFIHSCVSGPLDCFHVLVIVNSAAVNTKVHATFQIRVFSVHICIFSN